MRMAIPVLATALAVAPFAATPAAASDETDVLATVKQYNDYFNRATEIRQWDFALLKQPSLMNSRLMRGKAQPRARIGGTPSQHSPRIAESLITTWHLANHGISL